MRKAVNLKPETEELLRQAKIKFLEEYKEQKPTDDNVIRAALQKFAGWSYGKKK